MIDTKIKAKKNCVGCYACENICPVNCISMISDEEGFWYPKVDNNKCIKCGKCVNVCPTINYETVKNEPVAYACMNKDESIRLESSSGGIFTLIAEQIVEEGGTVFGAGFDENFEVVHSCVDNKEEIKRFRGSKYVQSRIGDSYKKVKKELESGKEVLFTGTPCQISGLKNFLGKSYKNLFCIDIICHGVPSPAVWKKYIGYREKMAGSPAKRIAFRRKDEGWKRFSVSFQFENNTEYRQNFREDLYMKAFLKDICLRPSCYDCKFKSLHRQSDITLADFWGVQNILPDMDDDKGTSLIFINSIAGQAMFEKIKNKIIFEKVDINEAIKHNSSAVKSVNLNPRRNEFFSKINDEPIDELIRKYCSDNTITIVKKKLYVVLKKAGLLNMVKRLLKKA